MPAAAVIPSKQVNYSYFKYINGKVSMLVVKKFLFTFIKRFEKELKTGVSGPL